MNQDGPVVEALLERSQNAVKPCDGYRPSVADGEVQIADGIRLQPNGRLGQGENGFDVMGIGCGERLGVIRAT